MKITEAGIGDKIKWNIFVQKNYPPVGAFMQTWEWVDFQKEMGRDIGRYFVIANGEPVAAFTLVYHALPFGLQYGYSPRGPVMAKKIQTDRSVIKKILETIKEWAKKEFPSFIFLRLEPPIAPEFIDTEDIALKGFNIPPYYIQPRYNLAVRILEDDEKTSAQFHPTPRSNFNRAEKRGATANIAESMSAEDRVNFMTMMRDTVARHGGKDVYPGEKYFKALLNIIPAINGNYDPSSLGLRIYRGFEDGQPAAMNLTVVFGDTMTYLYGAAHTKHLKSKVTTYLHWHAMKDSRHLGLRYYDLGGIDEKRWPTLTAFKRQFRGEEFDYIGNIDIPLKPIPYKIYNLLRGLK